MLNLGVVVLRTTEALLHFENTVSLSYLDQGYTSPEIYDCCQMSQIQHQVSWSEIYMSLGVS